MDVTLVFGSQVLIAMGVDAVFHHEVWVGGAFGAFGLLALFAGLDSLRKRESDVE